MSFSFPMKMTVNNLEVVLYKYPENGYRITAEGYDWTISMYYTAEDWRDKYYEFIERIIQLDIGPKSNPQNKELSGGNDKDHYPKALTHPYTYA